MDIKKRDFLLAGAAIGAGIAASGAASTAAMAQGDGEGGGGNRGRNAPVNSGKQPSSVDLNYKPRRLNKCIELWEDGQPIYYTGWGVGPGVDPYEQGKKMCKTWADAISIEMEHGLFDLKDLREFMRGLKDGGGTKSGHRFPGTFVTPPVIGLDEAYARANTWVLEQILCTGVTGIHIVHARSTKAIETYALMGCRYPFQDRPGVKRTAMQGLRGNSASYAANIWGVAGGTYQHIADLWPLNPKGEIMFGVKIEDTYADKTVDATLALPGIAFAEWGPGDHNLWLNGYNSVADGGMSGHPVLRDKSGKVISDVSALPNMEAVRQKTLAACKRNKVMFLNAAETEPGHNNVIQQIKDGTMVVAAGRGGEAVAQMGREYTKRKMPV
jgi:4-hydroxy-2-oxoheptanedioate aldolase